MSLAEAGQATLAFLQEHVPAPRTVPLAGNSIGTDRRFLAAYLPEIEEWLHYRSVDVSSIKELSRRWYPEAVAGAPTKATSHRAMDDILESVAELAYYRQTVFRDPPPPTEGVVGTGVTATTPPSLAEVTARLTAPGQLFEMEDVDIRGVSTRVWKQAPATLPVILELSMAQPDADYLVYEDERTTFGQHYRIASTLARRLRDDHGVRPGDRVAVAMRNLPEWVMAFWGISLAGAVVVPLNAWWTGEELHYGLADAEATVAFVDRERLERLRPHLGDLHDLRTLVVTDEDRIAGRAPGPRTATVPEIDFASFLGQVEDDAGPPEVAIDPDDDATLFYTSGTTGRPKGVVGTHRNACSNLMNLFFINTAGAQRFGSSLADDSGKVQTAYLLSIPLFHVTGCLAVMIGTTAAGGKLVMLHHFDPERALELIERERITTFGGVPATVLQVLDSPALATRDVSSVRSIAYGGAPAPPDLVRRIGEHFPVGQPSNGYGLTETSAVTTMNSGPDYVARPDSVGRPMPVNDLAVVPEHFEGPEPEPSRPTGPDVVGELWIKGPQVVRGYWHRPEDTAQVFTRGWLHTGDIARIDEQGFVYILDRAKDMIIRGGENISSVEVEDALYEHPAVAEAAVVGVPSERLGEEVGAVVVLRPGAKVGADELARHVGERLAAFKVPTHFTFRKDPLPRNPAGKVLKRSLRDQLAGSEGTPTTRP